MRAIFKYRYVGSLKNLRSSLNNLASTILRGFVKSNAQYILIMSKTRNGSFGLKTWVSSHWFIPVGLQELGIDVCATAFLLLLLISIYSNLNTPKTYVFSNVLHSGFGSDSSKKLDKGKGKATQQEVDELEEKEKEEQKNWQDSEQEEQISTQIQKDREYAELIQKKDLEEQGPGLEEYYDEGTQDIIAFNIEKDKIRRHVKKIINEKQKQLLEDIEQNKKEEKWMQSQR